MSEQATVLLIEDDEEDTTVICSVEARVVRLSEFTYVNTLSGRFTGDLVDDLNLVASCPHEALRVAGFERIATWLARRHRRLLVAAPGSAADDAAAVAAAVTAWCDSVDPDVAAEFTAANTTV